MPANVAGTLYLAGFALLLLWFAWTLIVAFTVQSLEPWRLQVVRSEIGIVGGVCFILGMVGMAL